MSTDIQLKAAERIVDMHCHVAGLGYGNSGCFISPAMRKNIRFRYYLRAFGIHECELKQHGDRYLIKKLSEELAQSKQVHKAVLLAMDGVVTCGELDRDKTEIYIPDEYLAQEASMFGQFWGASINPLRKDALERLQWAKDKGAVLVKWLPGVMGFDPNDAQCDAFYAKLVELNMPLLVHVGPESSFTRIYPEYLQPHIIDRAIVLKVKIIVAHVGLGGKYTDCRTGEVKDYMNEVLSRMQHENVYADISALTLVNHTQYIKRVRNAPIQHKLLYGTDFPLVKISLISSIFYGIGKVPLWQLLQIHKLKNAWDRDVAIKKAWGFPDAIFSLPHNFLTKN